jgi:hypothetical protein
MSLRRLILIGFLAIPAMSSLVAPCIAATYYVDAINGSDGNKGTSQSAPWQSIGRVNAANLSPGSSILFKGGESFSGGVVANTAGAKYTSYGSGRATICSGGETGLRCTAGGVRVSNLNFVGSGSPSNPSDGIDVGGATNNITITYVDVSEYSGGAGINVYGSHNGVTVTHVKSYNNMSYGISVYGADSTKYDNANVLIAYCETYGNCGTTSNSYDGNGITLQSVNGAVVEHCSSHDNGLNCTGCGGPCGIWTIYSNNVIIQFNESYHNRSQYDGNGTACDNDGFDLDGGTTNCILQYNYSHDNDGAGLMCWSNGAGAPTNNIIRYNISQNDGNDDNAMAARQGAGILVGGWPYAVNLQIYNNTLYDGGAGMRPVVDVEGATSSGFRNNIVMSVGGIELVGGAACAFQGNDYWSAGGALNIAGYASISAWRNATGQEMLDGQPVGYNVNPMLRDAGGGGSIDNWERLETGLSAYLLKSGSPMIGAGLNLSSFGIDPGSRDYYGDPISSVWDIGADCPSG